MKGRRQPGLGATLGTLFRTAVDQLGSVRDVVDRGTQLQKNWFDATLLQRKRKDALALLGEAVYRAAIAGHLERVAEDPQFRRLVDDIDELDQRIDIAEQRARGPEPGAPAQPGRPIGARGPAEEPRVWRPVAPWTPPDAPPEGAARPRRRTPSRTGEVVVPGAALARDEHAELDGRGAHDAGDRNDEHDDDEYDDYDALDGDAAFARPGGDVGVVRAARRRPPGISPDALGDDFGHRIDGDDAVSAFPDKAARHLTRPYDGDGDDDLADYMHEDDVPDAEELAASGDSRRSPRDAPSPPKPRRSRAAAAKRAKKPQEDS